MVSTGENPLPVGTIVGGRPAGPPPATPLAPKTPHGGADSGASSPREPPERMQSGGLRMTPRLLVHATARPLAPGRRNERGIRYVHFCFALNQCTLANIYFSRVLFRRGSLRNGYHIQGRQQARKLPNPDTGR